MADVLIWGTILLFTLLTLLPLSKIPHGFVRSAEFPRLQILSVCLLGLPFAWWTLDGAERLWAMGLFALIGAIQAAYILRFTPLWHRQSVRADDALANDPDRSVSFVAANVKMSNRDYGRLLDVVQGADPDLLMLLEVDQPWIDAMGPLRDTYPHAVEIPHDNGYGMALYSKVDLFDTEVRELLVERVPSIRTGVRLPSGDRFRLYVLHPEPPIPVQDTEGRDSEIAHVGMEAKNDPLPSVVSGDLNDVAWSSTTRRFQRLSQLLDPRVGRGFFNTFDARIPVMRWPLDHLFHDARFRLIAVDRLGKTGSDHFPIFYSLALARTEKALEEPGEIHPEEKKEVKEMIAREKERDREAIGSDWESD